MSDFFLFLFIIYRFFKNSFAYMIKHCLCISAAMFTFRFSVTLDTEYKSGLSVITFALNTYKVQSPFPHSLYIA